MDRLSPLPQERLSTTARGDFWGGRGPSYQRWDSALLPCSFPRHTHVRGSGYRERKRGNKVTPEG